MASATFYTIAQHKPIVQRLLSFMSNNDAFALFCVSSRLRSMWFIQYQKIGKTRPFEERAKQIQKAREWRKALDLEARMQMMTGKTFDIYKCDPMEKFRMLVKRTEREARDLKKERREKRDAYVFAVQRIDFDSDKRRRIVE